MNELINKQKEKLSKKDFIIFLEKEIKKINKSIDMSKSMILFSCLLDDKFTLEDALDDETEI